MFPPVAKPGLGLQQTHTESRPWSEPHSLLDPRWGLPLGGGPKMRRAPPWDTGRVGNSLPLPASGLLRSSFVWEVRGGAGPGRESPSPPFFPTLRTRGRQGHGGGAGASRPRGSPPPPGPEPQGGVGRGRRPRRGAGSDFLLCGRVTRRGSRCGPGVRRGAAARPYLAISAPPEPRPPPPGSPARGSAVPACRRP